MLEPNESLLPLEQGKLKVVTVGTDDDSLAELDRLLTTLGVEPMARVQMKSPRINPATYIGVGKLEEVKQVVEGHEAGGVVFDVDLSPNQAKNLEKALGKPVVDRSGVIIEIFSQHARTKEAKTQVELARLEYLLPRLAHLWTHFERQRGGIGLKGMGEKQIEVDRRLVKKRMAILQSRLKSIEKERNVQRAGRKDFLKVALVGYTNAGKSTLLNALTQSKVLAENKLFATLDSSARALDPDSHPPVIMIDTVGFISRLPPSLVASFRSTLEELNQADMLVHVVDGSAEQAREQMEVTEEILKDLGVESKPRITVLNKADLVATGMGRNRLRLVSPGSMVVSALNREDMKKLRDRILEHFKKELDVWEIVLPYSESRLEARIHEYGSIEQKRHVEKGTFFRVRINEEWAKKLGLEKYRL